MIEQYTSRLNKIEEELESAFPRKSTEEWLKKATGCNNPVVTNYSSDNINNPCHELIYRGGKRWRPLAMLLTAECFKADTSLILKLTPFVELIHNGTLLIDDIEDKAVERRGKPSIHLIYGEDVAINSGNHLYFSPTFLLDQIESNDIKLKLYQSFASNMRRLHFGQGLDIQWHNDISKIPSVEEYIQMCKFKTGCLASMSAEFAGICCNLDSESVEKLRVIFEEIGVGFQIMDDIINITTGNPGKDRGDDIVEGKKSLPVILYCNNNPKEELLKNISKAKKRGIKKGKKYVEKAIDILNSDTSIVDSKDVSTKLIKNNLEKLEEILPDCSSKDLLLNLFKNFLKTDY